MQMRRRKIIRRVRRTAVNLSDLVTTAVITAATKRAPSDPFVAHLLDQLDRSSLVLWCEPGY